MSAPRLGDAGCDSRLLLPNPLILPYDFRLSKQLMGPECEAQRVLIQWG